MVSKDPKEHEDLLLDWSLQQWETSITHSLSLRQSLRKVGADQIYPNGCRIGSNISRDQSCQCGMEPDFVSWLKRPEACTSILRVIDRNRQARGDGRRRGFLEIRRLQKRSRRPVEVNEYSPSNCRPPRRRPLSWYLPYRATIFSLITPGESLQPRKWRKVTK